MEIMSEKESPSLRVFECMLNYLLGDAPLPFPDFVHHIPESTPPQLAKLMDPSAPGVAAMLRSPVLSWVKEAHCRFSQKVVLMSLTSGWRNFYPSKATH
mmetsp:Transcript_8373/g.12746  ORF Transcript_8373/g.12746 Transcript_8373/m.12746 type:complete len:99 (+) Transcript_8373:212-508(+)